MKQFNELSLQVTEEVYRADTAISYSTLSTYARGGLTALKNTLDGVKLDTSSLRYGSAVDTLLTDANNFDKLYFVADYKEPSDDIKKIVDLIWSQNQDKTNLLDIETGKLLNAINTIGYGASNWKEQTKIDKIIEGGNNYFQLLPLTLTGKKLLKQEDYDLAVKNVDTLKNHPFTRWIFDKRENFETHYQLKFKITFDHILDIENIYKWKDELLEKNTIRCMFDIICVDHANKIIYPIDLKTTYHNENEFDTSIQDWYYDIQATMYYYILDKVVLEDEFYRNYVLAPFMFLPINKYNNAPMLWKYESSAIKYQDTFIDYKNREHFPWNKYLKEVRYAIDNQEFNYDRETIEGGGIKIIKFN